MARTTGYSGKGGIRINVNFTPLLERIMEAEGNVEEATFKAARVGGKEMYNELVAESAASGVPGHIISDIAFKAERDSSGNRVAVGVGWRMPENVNYDNLSSGQKAAILNYGTPSRKTKSGDNRGWVNAANFIRRAKKKARPKVKKAQKACLEEILKGLK